MLTLKTPLTFGLALVLLPALRTDGCGGATDEDQDGLPADTDNCADNYNPSQMDTDQDGVGDPCDTESPRFDTALAECYKANFSGLNGPYWQDAAMWLYEDYKGVKWVIMYWNGEYPEYAIQYDNGRDIWSMLYNDQVPEWTGTWFELLATEVADDGVVSRLEGPVLMLECANCESNVSWSAYYEGTMTAERTATTYCTGE